MKEQTKKQPKLFDEIPLTRYGLEEFIKQLDYEIIPRRKELNKLILLYEEATLRLKRYHG